MNIACCCSGGGGGTVPAGPNCGTCIPTTSDLAFSLVGGGGTSSGVMSWDPATSYQIPHCGGYSIIWDAAFGWTGGGAFVSPVYQANTAATPGTIEGTIGTPVYVIYGNCAMGWFIKSFLETVSPCFGGTEQDSSLVPCSGCSIAFACSPFALACTLASPSPDYLGVTSFVFNQ